MAKSISPILSAYGLSVDSTMSEISNGLINNTYLVSDPKTELNYVLQQINRSVFRDVDALMSNMRIVNTHLNASEDYHAPRLIQTLTGKDYFEDGENHSWRLFEYIENCKTINLTSSNHIAQEAGNVIGRFHSALVGFDSTRLSVTIPHFHDLDWRLNQLKKAQKSSQKANEQTSKTFFTQIQALKDKFKSLSNGSFPSRVTHNDTKLNNILFDQDDKGICLIDLDTLMPGYLHTDFGDALRTLASSVSENESDTSKVFFSIDIFKFFTYGSMSEMRDLLTEDEKTALPLSIPFMPFIMAVRFFTDYLNGNVYYKVNYPDQNFDRAKNQLSLVKSIFSQFDEINNVFQELT
jgi:Ser/Thr protein kinase RdoA (MazF antagonist)